MDWTADMNAALAKSAKLKSELDVVNGTACAEEQADGNGPCGICRACYARRLNEAMGLIEQLASFKATTQIDDAHALALMAEAFQFIMKGPNDTKSELERKVVRYAKQWANDQYDDDRALVRAIEDLLKEEKRRESR